ncbi:DUF4430 domain-containing protein [Fusibacter sp. JL298sf-3]
MKKKIIYGVLIIAVLAMSYFMTGPLKPTTSIEPLPSVSSSEITLSEKPQETEKPPERVAEEESTSQIREVPEEETPLKAVPPQSDEHDEPDQNAGTTPEEVKQEEVDAAEIPESEPETPPAEESAEESVAPPTSTEEKDEYLTDPIPEGKPQPVEWQDTEIDTSTEGYITLSVSCKTILDNLDLLEPNKLELVPEDGVIFPEKQVAFYEGESVFDVLHREMKGAKIHMEFVMTPMYNSNYIEGINNLYEFDCGELSGWMYKVNDWFPNYGASRYQLKEGDVVEWVYTCDLGRDLGASGWGK